MRDEVAPKALLFSFAQQNYECIITYCFKIDKCGEIGYNTIDLEWPVMGKSEGAFS